MNRTRAREIFENAKTFATCGPWSDQLDKVMTAAERLEIKELWQLMPGHTCFVDALLRFVNAPDSLYDACVAAGIKIANHESDLYIPANDTTRGLLMLYGKKPDGWNVQTFTNQVEGGLWYDVPFAFLPWWDKRMAEKGQPA